MGRDAGARRVLNSELAAAWRRIRRQHFAALRPLSRKIPQTCMMDGCDKRAYGLWCRLHKRRRVDGLPLNYKRPPPNRQRYRMLRRPHHPIAIKNGCVAEHRMVLYDHMYPFRYALRDGSLGREKAGPVPCFWCGRGVTWGLDLVVDHLDHDRGNNVPRNLVPACHSCNSSRTVVARCKRDSIYAPA